MAIKLVISNTVGVKVKGTFTDENGIQQPFDFRLTCMRLDADQLSNKFKSEFEASTTDFLADVVEDWSGVRGADDKPIPYDEAGLRQLCKIPGVAQLAFRTYLAEVGVKEKN